jgi:acyl-CoA synthetase (AMP-forming)/AMP-acid ligase II
VENALYEDHRIMEAAAIGVPDERRGEFVAAVVYPKPAFKGQVVEEELIEFARKRLALLFTSRQL